MSAIRGLTELVIWVRDMEKALQFYRDALGLSIMSPPDFGGGGLPPSRRVERGSSADRASSVT